MKTCLDCGVTKPISDFYTQKRAHGRAPTSYCKPCDHKRSKAARRRNPQTERNYRASIRPLIRERSREYAKRYAGSRKRWAEKNAERVALSNKGSHAVRSARERGDLIRPANCEACGVACKPDAAHRDYSRPLDVRWLCRSCHRKWDQDDPKTLNERTIGAFYKDE